MPDLDKTERLATDDPCEFRFPARGQWHPGIVVVNGGYGYWIVRGEDGCTYSLYIENVRAPRTDPWFS